MKNKKTWVIAGLVAFVVCLSLVLMFFVFRQNAPEPTEPQPTGAPVEHSVYVKTSKGDPLEGIAVYVYTDSERTELAWFNKTDAEGKMTFTDIPSDSYVAVLENVPTGYGVDEYYPLTGVETEIILSVGQMTEENMQNLTYQLGDLVMDFTVTATDGTVYMLSELLQEKQAVVLNFWYLDCQPCLQEFPFLQEAYAEYSEKIAVLGMNPIDKVEDIAAFQQEMGYTFPLAAVDQSWIDIMKISAFPTTVVIDRYGNITLIHTGSIDNAQTFKDVFEYFCAEEYEQKLIKDITEIESEKEEGTEENPEELGSVLNFEVTVGPGEVYYTELYRVTDMYLTIYSKHAYVIYKDKTYEPRNGVISILLECPDMNTPVKVGIGNKSEEEQKFTVYLIPKPGTFNNPYQLPIGEFTASVEAGNEKGVYYIYTATEDGALAIQCLNSTPGVKYAYYLYNLNNYQMRTLEEDGQDLENGRKYIYIQVRKGEQVQFSIGTLPDETNKYPGGTFQMLTKFISANGSGDSDGSGDFGDLENGFEMEEERTINTVIDYTVTLKDQFGNAVSGVFVQMSGTVNVMDATSTKEAITESVEKMLVTDGDGKATLSTYPGTVNAIVHIPEGYSLDKTEYTLTKDAPSISITLSKIQLKDYKIKVQTIDGVPVEGVILVANGKVAYSDANGSATFSFLPGTYSVLALGISSEYTLDVNAYKVTADAPELTIELGYAPGHMTNPIEIREQGSIVVNALAANSSIHYAVYDVDGIMLEMTGVADAYITVNGVKYEPDADGKISALMEAPETQDPEVQEPVSLAVFNTKDEPQKQTVNFLFAEGTRFNPKKVLTKNKVKLSAAVESYWYYWTPGDNNISSDNVTDGSITIKVDEDPDEYNYDVIITNGTKTEKLSESDNSKELTFTFTGNKQILIQFVATQPLDEEISISAKKSNKLNTGETYSVTVVDSENKPRPGVQLQFKSGSEVLEGIYTTNNNGVVTTALPSGSYMVVLLDESYEYDKATARVTVSKPDVKIVANQTEVPVPEGMTRYTLTVTHFNTGNLLGDYLALFMQNGEPVGYNIIPEAGGATIIDLPTGIYDVQIIFLGSEIYYYESSNVTVTPERPELVIRAAEQNKSKPVENYALGQITPLSLGVSYVQLVNGIDSYFSFHPTQQGVYQFTVYTPNVKLSYWNSPDSPSDQTDQLDDYTGYSFTRSVNTNAIGQTHVIGLQGAKGCIVSVQRVADAIEDAVYTPYQPKKEPVKQTLQAGMNLTYFDITKPTSTYNLVRNDSDGYYHLGSANGPVVYVQLNYNADGKAAPYNLTLYEIVGGVGNQSSGLKGSYIGSDGERVYEEYSECMIKYGACADTTYGVYPLTDDLIHMIRNGGEHKGWWDPNHPNSKFLFTRGENMEIAWMFALCYFN